MLSRKALNPVADPSEAKVVGDQRTRHLALIDLTQGDDSPGGGVVGDEQVASNYERVASALNLNRDALSGPEIGHQDDIVWM